MKEEAVSDVKEIKRNGISVRIRPTLKDGTTYFVADYCVHGQRKLVWRSSLAKTRDAANKAIDKITEGQWAQIVDWIVQHLFQTVPLMEGHRQAQERVSNPALVWLRSVALAVNESGELNQALTATDIFGLCDSADISVPGLRPDADEDKGKKIIGTIMAKLFREDETLEVDGFAVTREERYLNRDDACEGGGFKSKTYTVTKL